jgi:hypothetical protein
MDTSQANFPLSVDSIESRSSRVSLLRLKSEVTRSTWRASFFMSRSSGEWVMLADSIDSMESGAE